MLQASRGKKKIQRKKISWEEKNDATERYTFFLEEHLFCFLEFAQMLNAIQFFFFPGSPFFSVFYIEF